MFVLIEGFVEDLAGSLNGKVCNLAATLQQRSFFITLDLKFCLVDHFARLLIPLLDNLALQLLPESAALVEDTVRLFLGARKLFAVLFQQAFGILLCLLGALDGTANMFFTPVQRIQQRLPCKLPENKNQKNKGKHCPDN